jgi:hypothetical protein
VEISCAEHLLSNGDKKEEEKRKKKWNATGCNQ